VSVDVRLARPATLRRLRLTAPQTTVRRPTRVVVDVERAGQLEAEVAPDGTVTLPRAVRARRFTLIVRAARFPAGTSGRERLRRAVGIAEIEGVPGARVTDAPGRLRGRCGDATVRTAAGVKRLRAVGSTDDLERGEPIRAEQCGAPFALPTGRQDVTGGRGVLDVDHLRLGTASVPSPLGSLPAQPGPGSDAGPGSSEPTVDGPVTAGEVVDPGRDDQRGARDGVRVRVTAPGWLVLGEGFNRAWRATCDGEDLGAPVPLQGYATAWRVAPGCEDVAFAWAPNRLFAPAYALSALACLVLVGVLLRRRLRRTASEPRALLPADRPGPWPLRKALLAGLAAAVVLGFVFALRAGIVLGPVIALVLWRGVDARHLALAGGAILATVVPLLYLLIDADDKGGFNTNLAVERIGAHWVGVGAVTLLVAALWRTLAAARAAHPDRPRLPGRRRPVRDRAS
jgi:hypothetical protein